MTDTYVLKAYLWKRNDAKVSGVFLAMSLRVFFFFFLLLVYLIPQTICFLHHEFMSVQKCIR